jgi:hypothetical protein
LLAGAAMSLAALNVSPVMGQTAPVDPAPDDIASIARRTLDRLGPLIPHPERVAVADFGRPSWQPRLHLIDMISGEMRSLLVAHGCGSDPAFSGCLWSFSNAVGSQASCEGAFRTLGRYEGAHGRSMRLAGLDRTNSNARRRDIVIHAADYVSPQVVDDIGKLGWSEGCFAIDRRDLDMALERLSPGHLLVSAQLTATAPGAAPPV